MDKPFCQTTAPEKRGLEHWFRQRRTLTDFRRGPLGPHFDGFAQSLAAKGYSLHQARRMLAVGCQFNVFLLDRGITELAGVSDSLMSRTALFAENGDRFRHIGDGTDLRLSWNTVVAGGSAMAAA
ncbi:MAG: hypothetical protein ACREFX_06135, partial [Opitutaceae bacterium]